MALFTLTQGNRQPSYSATLTKGDGTVQDLTGATVQFRMRARGTTSGSPKVSAAATIVSPATNGIVQYDWASGDTDTPGTYDVDLIVTLSSRTVSFPSGIKDTVLIVPAL